MDVEGIDEDEDFNHVVQDGISGADATGRISRNPSVVSPINNEGDLPHQHMDDALVYSWDGPASGTLIKRTTLRRNVKMVLDDENDD